MVAIRAKNISTFRRISSIVIFYLVGGGWGGGTLLYIGFKGAIVFLDNWIPVKCESIRGLSHST